VADVNFREELNEIFTAHLGAQFDQDSAIRRLIELADRRPRMARRVLNVTTLRRLAERGG